LKYNIEQNELKDITIYNQALGHTFGETTLGGKVYESDSDSEFIVSYDPDKPCNLGGIGFGSGGEKVSLHTIDELNLTECDFIKIDVEGAENLVIMGALQTILSHRPSILFESNHKKLSKDTLTSLGIDFELKSSHEMLADLGYKKILPITPGNYLAFGQAHQN
jgi:FkbM family methyltransferase